MGASISTTFNLLHGRKMHIVMTGLDAVGKTTILYKLKLGEIIFTIPDLGLSVETVKCNNVIIDCWDVGGGTRHRFHHAFWQTFLQNTYEAVIFVVDSDDRKMISKAREELHQLLSAELLKGAPLLVFANKQDLPNPMNVLEITDKLGLQEIRDRECFILPSCATLSEGLHEGFNWLFKVLRHSGHGHAP